MACELLPIDVIFRCEGCVYGRFFIGDGGGDEEDGNAQQQDLERALEQSASAAAVVPRRFFFGDGGDDRSCMTPGECSTDGRHAIVC